MSEQTMIERCAAAMSEEAGRGALGGDYAVDFDRLARAAIAVIRDPTEEMVDVGSMADVPWEYVDVRTNQIVSGPFALELSGPNKIERAKEVVSALWRAMIDAALAPTPDEGE